jgi:hypothetical protein
MAISPDDPLVNPSCWLSGADKKEKERGRKQQQTSSNHQGAIALLSLCDCYGFGAAALHGENSLIWKQHDRIRRAVQAYNAALI